MAQQSRHLSPDGGWQWTGTQWVPNTQAPTQTGHLSPDGRWLWTGIQWVPNTQASVQSGLPLWARAYESARTRSNLVTIFLLGNLLGLLVGMIFDVVDIDYLQTTTPSDSLTFADGLLAIVYVLAFYGTLIPAVVFFCMWLHRVVRNMPALGAADPRWSPAVGAAILAALVVRDVTARQDRKNDLIASGELA